MRPFDLLGKLADIWIYFPSTHYEGSNFGFYSTYTLSFFLGRRIKEGRNLSWKACDQDLTSSPNFRH